MLLILIAVLHIAYHTFSPNDKGVNTSKENLVYFQDSYSVCRENFLTAIESVGEQFKQAEHRVLRVPSQVDTGLYVDLLYIPPVKDSARLLVLSSGIHGVEGFTGSAVQQMFLAELLTKEVLSDMGVLLIHGINPYGFKYLRRVTENNVDLNRGSDIDPSLFINKNEGYGEVYDLLNPIGEVSTFSLQNQFFHLRAIQKILKYSKGVLRQAVLQGQYEYPDGVYFGGQDFEPQIDSLKIILPGIFDPYERVLAIDLHTGYGERGALHLFPNPVNDPVIKSKTESVFKGYKIDWGDTDDFYSVTGGFVDPFLGKLCPDATYLYMAFEWGTYDSQKTFGSLQSLQTIVMENQGYHYGYKKPKQESRIKKRTLEFYNPSSAAWRSRVIESGRDMLKVVLKTFPKVE